MSNDCCLFMGAASEEISIIRIIVEAHIEYRKGKGSFTLNEIAKMYAGDSFQSRVPKVRTVIVDLWKQNLIEPLDDVTAFDISLIPGPTRFRKKKSRK